MAENKKKTEKRKLTPEELHEIRLRNLAKGRTINRMTPEEAKEFHAAGGRAAAAKKRQLTDTTTIVKRILASDADKYDVTRFGNLLSQYSEQAGEDMRIEAVMVAGLIRAAINGDVRAFLTVQDLLAEKKQDEDPDQAWHLPITDITSDFVEVYRLVQDVFEGRSNVREIISKGGRGSVKSSFWAGVVYETIKHDKQAHAVMTRRYKTDLRGSVYNQFMKTVIRHGDLDNWDFTTAPMMARYKKTGQCVIFVGADKPISLKSYNLAFGYVKLIIHEECDEMAGVEQMDNIEDTFLRDDVPALDVKIFNPPKSANNFMNVYTEEKANDPATYIVHSFYYHTPVRWLGQRFFDRAEWFKAHKPDYYRNNYLGEVVGTGGQIFANVEARTITDAEIETFDGLHHGLDYGYEHPQVLEVSHYDRDTDTLYCLAEVYSRQCKNSTFARKIRQYKNVEIIADSARPDSIAEMRDWGFFVTPAVKRWGGGRGRDYCWEWLQQTTKIVIDPARCPRLYYELTHLEHEQLRDGSFSSAYPTLGEDCTMALIYGLNRVIKESRRDDLTGEYVEDEEEEESEGEDLDN